MHICLKSGASISITLEFKYKERGGLKHYNILPSYNKFQIIRMVNVVLLK